MLKFKVGDTIRVIAGKDKGREGTIEAVYPAKSQALVQGVNIYKKHIKKSMTKDQKGGIFEIPRPISFAKIALVDPKTKKPTRVGFKIDGNKKVRISKKSGTVLDKVNTKNK